MKRALLAATAVLTSSFVPFLTTPAFANAPITYTSGLTPQQICDNQLKPNYNSDFQTVPQNVSYGEWTPVGAPVATDPAGDPSGYGTPTPGGITYNGTYYRNGGSPNVWGGGSSTLTYPQTQQLFHFEQDVTRTDTFDCYVWKIVGHDNVVDPAGLQSTGNTTTETDTIPAPDAIVITNVPYVVYGATVISLICISPNNTTKSKPGTWTQMHGFTGSCTNASTLAGGTIPSNNAPTTDSGTTFNPNN